MSSRPSEPKEYILKEDDLQPLLAFVGAAATKWREIGVGLKFTKNTLDAIAATSENTTPIACFTDLLRKWLKYTPPKHDLPTVEKLAKALRVDTVYEDRIAYDLTQKYHCTPSDAVFPPPEATSSTTTTVQPQQESGTPSDAASLPSTTTTVQPQQESEVDALTSSACAYASVPNVQVKIHEFERQFNVLKKSTREDLELHNIDVRAVVECLKNLPADDIPEHRVFQEEHIDTLLQADSLLKLFLLMDRYWNYLAYHLLEHLIKEFSVWKMREEMEKYKDDLQEFIWDIPLEVFPQAQKAGVMDLPAGFEKVVATFEWPENVTMAAVKQFQQKYAHHYNLHKCALLLITIHPGSFTVVWGIPESVTQHLKKIGAEDILSEVLVTRLEVAGVCVYEQMLTPSGSATDGLPERESIQHEMAISAVQEYEFVNPSEEFLCPVTLEVLLDPHQTQCCGHELSAEVAIVLQKRGKACPLCNEPQFTSYPDRRFRRKVHEQQVYCPNYKRGCRWVGELAAVGSHEKFCPRKNSPIMTDVVPTAVRTSTASTKEEEPAAEVVTIELSDLDTGLLLGRGGSGDVYEGNWKKYGEKKVAVKVIRSSATSAHLVEIKVWSSLDPHPNIVTFLGVAYSKVSTYLVSELAVNGSLFNYLHEKKCTPPVDQSLAWASDVANGMKYLHDHDIIHRDLKSANVLLTRRWVAKLGDFGSSRQLIDSTTTEQAGTYRWMSPEIMRRYSARINKKCDSFSYGMILFELFAHEIPYADLKDKIEVLLSVISGKRPPIPPTLPQYLHDLLRSCWEEDPKLRPTFADIVDKIKTK